MSLSSFVMLAFAIIGFVANGQFEEAVVGDDGALEICSKYFVKINALIASTRGPFQTIANNLGDNIENVIEPLLNTTVNATNATANLNDRLDDFSLD